MTAKLIAKRGVENDETIDVTGVAQARVGDEAVLIGASGKDRIGFGDWAAWSETIPYEVVTRLGPRGPRVYR